MQLLHSRASPVPEFVSLSLLMKAEIEATDTIPMDDPLLVPSPLATLSPRTIANAVGELHQYLVSVHKVTMKNPGTKMKTSFRDSFLREDEHFLSNSHTQVFRPINGQGVGLHYKLVKDRGSMAPLVRMALRSSSGLATETKASTKTIEKEVVGVIFCVGIVGIPSVHVASSVHYSLSQRMDDCTNILSRTSTGDNKASCLSLLNTFLMTETENKLTNFMSKGKEFHLFSNMEDGRGGLLNPKKKIPASAAEVDFENPLSVNSSDQARLMIERLAVLSVADNETIFRKFDGKMSEKANKVRRRRGGRDADLDGFDFRGESKGTLESSTSGTLGDNASVKSSSSRLLKESARDSIRIAPPKPRNTSVPALMASNKDTGAKGRRQLANDNGGRNRQASRRQTSGAFQSNWGVEAGNNNGSSNNFDPFAMGSSDAMSMASESSSSRKKITKPFERTDASDDIQFQSDMFGASSGTSHSRRRHGSSTYSSSNNSETRLLVNVALNEDLTCFYKQSKMVSCSVEGVAQVQVKTNADEAPSFMLKLRDPSNNILSIQENKKFAEETNRGQGFKFTISVPKGDNYFPVMRYKCNEALRPVPIRVQTRVREEGSHCRIALQISSNPHNEDSLTDLTIIMGVPASVRGETLTTSPAGGVWNAAKRSVIWCVATLGGGEKFQLQARFEIDNETAVDEDSLKFPVLVRCQCMHNQLSDVEIDVQDIPGTSVDVKMKVARRFRLSHRERP